jgi:uncharacterized SAM-binding protein YcdF (DUF218 family)
MFFYLSKFFALFLFPFSLFLIFSAIACCRLKPGKFKNLYIAIFISFLLLSTEPGSYILFHTLEKRYNPVAMDQLRESDAIVVLAGMVNPLTGFQGRPEFNTAVDRILAGEELLNKKKAPMLLISGGSGLIVQIGEKEAEILRNWLIQRSHNPATILAESESKNTAENAINTAKFAKKYGWKNIVLITSAFHMHRSVLTFQKQGMQVIPFPVDYYGVEDYYGPEHFVPSMDALYLSTTGFKEYIGLIAYYLRGYI